MSNFIDIYLICLDHSNNLRFIEPQGTNETSIEDKSKCLLPELELDSNIPKYICTDCGSNLSRSYEFKQKCLQNIIKYEKYAQQITTNSCNFVVKKERIQTEIEFVDIANNREFIIKEEAKEVSDDACNKNENIIGCDNISKQNDKFKCKMCKKSYKSLQNLKQHQFIHTNRYSCETCNKSFARLEHLKNHQLIHSGEKPFSCDICNKSFRRLDILKRHHLGHTGEKPFTCKVYNKTFRYSQSLRLSHTGEKPYTCEVCNESFKQSQHLNIHRLIHTGVKPFNCEVCKKSFRDPSNLKRHRLLHNKSHK